jgi:hypothetical protein
MWQIKLTSNFVIGTGIYLFYFILGLGLFILGGYFYNKK